jgi:hypothetical protein
MNEPSSAREVAEMAKSGAGIAVSSNRNVQEALNSIADSLERLVQVLSVDATPVKGKRA